MARVLKVRELGPQSRKVRRPQHAFQLRQRPWQIQPFLIAPVLPGETLRNLMIQSRVVSDPLTNALIGWWCEYYIFYVKHRDMDNRDTYTAMMLDLSAGAGSADAADPLHYHNGSHVNWSLQCLKRVVVEYFRNQGEAWNVATLGTLPLASVNDSSWLDSMSPVAAWTSADVNVDLNADATIKASEVDQAMAQWEFMKLNNMTDMSYEDFLASYGIRPKEQELYRPELIRYFRGWTYPTNTINPSTGAPTSAVSWAISERADKDRFFTEPGFIYGVSVVRPKSYRRKQVGSAVALMDKAQWWLPAIMHDDPNTSVQTASNGAGSPIAGQTTNYVWDVKDLFLYGDQFLNFDPTADGAANGVDLPLAAGGKRYPASADCDRLFVSAAPANQIRSDGIVSMQIASSIRETSPTY